MGDDKNFNDKTVIAEIGSLETAPKAQSQPCLVQYNGNGLGKRYPLQKDIITLGRAATVDITLAENSVSRVHAEVSVNNGEATINDCGSANGTFLNDKKVEAPTVLRDQDIIRLGTVLLKFFSKDNIDGYIQDKIYRMATIDVGTQIFNKQYLIDALTNEFASAKASHRPLSVIYFDLDHFKKVNDTYGHNCGDQVLRDNSKVVKALVRKDDIFARFGGEEFIIALPNTDRDTAGLLAERIRVACQEFSHILSYENQGAKKEANHKQTISIGVAQLSDEMKVYTDLLESADKKLYFSKQNGRNRVTL